MPKAPGPSSHAMTPTIARKSSVRSRADLTKRAERRFAIWSAPKSPALPGQGGKFRPIRFYSISTQQTIPATVGSISALMLLVPMGKRWSYVGPHLQDRDNVFTRDANVRLHNLGDNQM